MLQTNHLLSLKATYTVQYLAATTTASLDCMVLASLLNLHVCEINLGGDLGMRPICCLKASLVLSGHTGTAVEVLVAGVHVSWTKPNH